MQNTNVLICCRAEDAAGRAGRLVDRLAAQLGQENVFIATHPPEAADAQRLAAATVVLALVGPEGLLQADETYVHNVGQALAQNKRVVPVLVGDASFSADILPEALKGLAGREILQVRDRHFDEDAWLLTAYVKGHIGITGDSLSTMSASSRKLVVRLAIGIAIMMAGLWWLYKGMFPETYVAPRQQVKVDMEGILLDEFVGEWTYEALYPWDIKRLEKIDLKRADRTMQGTVNMFGEKLPIKDVKLHHGTLRFVVEGTVEADGRSHQVKTLFILLHIRIHGMQQNERLRVERIDIVDGVNGPMYQYNGRRTEPREGDPAVKAGDALKN